MHSGVLSKAFLSFQLDLTLELPGISSVCLDQLVPKDLVEGRTQALMTSLETYLKLHLRLGFPVTQRILLFT